MSYSSGKRSKSRLLLGVRAAGVRDRIQYRLEGAMVPRKTMGGAVLKRLNINGFCLLHCMQVPQGTGLKDGVS